MIKHFQTKYLAKYLIVLSSCVTLASTASAGVVVDHTFGGKTINDGSFYTNTGGNSWRIWDDFTITEDVTIDQIEYWTRGTLRGGADVTLSIGTAANSADIANLVFNFSDLLIDLPTSTSNQKITAGFSDINLAAGTYWLSFSGLGMFGSAIVPGDNFTQVFRDGQIVATRPNSGSLFRLSGDATGVPAPTGAVLLILGLMGMALRRRSAA